MFRRIKALVKKEFRQIRRDYLSLFVLVCVPAAMLALFGYALNFDVKHISMAICDQDNTRQSRDFIACFTHSAYFTIHYNLENSQGIDRLLDQGKVRVGLVIPSGFGNNLHVGKAESVQVLVDGTNSNTATTVVGYVLRLVQHYSSRLVKKQAAGSPISLSAALDVRPRIWYNPNLESARFLVPGLMGFVVMLSAVISTAMSVVREKERGTMEQLVVSPVSAKEIIIGKTIPYILISMLASLIILIAGSLLFGIQVKGSYIDLFIVTLVFIVANLFFGILISTIANSQQVAFMICVISTMVPTFVLSGFVFPIRNMPAAIQVVTYLIPTRYFMNAVRTLVLKGAGLIAFWQELAALVLYSLVVILASSIGLRRKGALA